MKGKHKIRLLAAAFLFLGLLPLTAVARNEAIAAPAPIDPDLLDRLARDGTANLFVQMSARADLAGAQGLDRQARGQVVWDGLNLLAQETQAPVLACARRHGLEAHPLAIDNSVYIRGATLRAAQELAALPGVARLRLEHTVSLAEPASPDASQRLTPSPEAEMAWGVADVRAPELWALGVRGAGVRVSSIDTGVQWDHPALIGQYGCPDDPGSPDCWCDPSNICGGLPCDNVGHGTFLMGQMAADDDPGLAYTAGIAPDATWITCKGCESGSCSEYALLACAEWLLAPGGDPGNAPHLVEFPLSWTCGNNWFLPAIQAWLAVGIIPFSKIGSDGPACFTTESPGDTLEVVGVGAYDIQRLIASFSSRGPSCQHELAKPNLVAPGVDICSTYPEDGWSCYYSGTAMASAYAAGGAALVLSACPELSGDLGLLLEVLQQNADEPPEGNCGFAPGGGNYTYGWGYLNVLAAVQSCAGLAQGTLEGQVTDQHGAPLEGMVVTAVPEPGGAAAAVAGEPASPGADAVTDPNGHYSMELVPGSYTVTAGGGTCEEQSVPGVVILEGQTTVLDFSLTCAAPWQEYGPLCFDWTRCDGEYVEATGKAYFLGGRPGASTVGDIYAFDPQSGECADTGADMPVPVSNYTANLVNINAAELLCTFGGRDVAGLSTPEVQCYDPLANSAFVKTLLPAAFDGFTPGGQAVVDNQVYVFGGLRTASPPYATAMTFRYDPQADTWTQLGDLGLARGYIMAAAVDGKVYAFGGDTYDGVNLTAQAIAEVLDPAAGTWDDAAVADLPAASGEGRAFGFGIGSGYVYEGQVILAGGGQWPVNSAEVISYDVATDTYNPAFPDLNAARRDHAGFFVPGSPGRMWVVGGWHTSDNPPFAPAEYYDVEPLLLPTMHVADITGHFSLDPYGRILLRVRVQIVDGEDNPLGDAAVKAIISPPVGEPVVRTRMTRPNGSARFHWGCLGCAGTWELCVEEVEKAGYEYNPADNVVTCQTWQN